MDLGSSLRSHPLWASSALSAQSPSATCLQTPPSTPMDNTLQILGQIEYMGHSHKPRGVGRQEFAVSFNFSKWKSLFCIDHI